jgi:hypothetical protein
MSSRGLSGGSGGWERYRVAEFGFWVLIQVELPNRTVPSVAVAENIVCISQGTED